MTWLELNGVSVTLNGSTILSNLNYQTDADRISIIGINGSGKSTLVRLLNKLAEPTSGEVKVFGKLPNSKDTAFLFSNPDLQVVMPTVSEDLAFSLRSAKLSKDEVEHRVQKTLDKVGLQGLKNAIAYNLSSGQKQLLALAGAIIREPKLLVADEPTTLLDAPNTKKISEILNSLNCKVITVTHDLQLAESSDETVWIEAGQIREVGPSKSVVAKYRKFYS